MKIHSSDEPCKIPLEQILQGVDALKKVLEAEKKEDDSHYLLQITVHKISAHKRKTTLINLPHPIYSKKTEICVFTKDVSEKCEVEESECFWGKHFEENCGFIPKIVPLDDLRKSYKSYEAKRQLCDSYELFLTDDAIVRFLPNKLGKNFYQKRKFPLDLKMTGDGFAKRVDDLLASTRWFNSGHGNCSKVIAATTDQSCEEVAANIESIVKAIAKTVDRGWENVRLIQLNTLSSSLSIPLYRNEAVDEEKLKDKSQSELDFLARHDQVNNKRAELGLKRSIGKKINRKKRARINIELGSDQEPSSDEEEEKEVAEEAKKEETQVVEE